MASASGHALWPSHERREVWEMACSRQSFAASGVQLLCCFAFPPSQSRLREWGACACSLRQLAAERSGHFRTQTRVRGATAGDRAFGHKAIRVDCSRTTANYRLAPRLTDVPVLGSALSPDRPVKPSRLSVCTLYRAEGNGADATHMHGGIEVPREDALRKRAKRKSVTTETESSALPATDDVGKLAASLGQLVGDGSTKLDP